MAETPVRVLTIDDEPFVRKSFRYFLDDDAFEVHEAGDGRAGLEAFERLQPDLVLLDLRMPEMDGLDVLSAIHARDPETPVIVVSGNGEMADVVEALRLGAWDFLIKPVQDLSVLSHALDKALERARLMRENRQYREHLEDLVVLRTDELARANQELHNLIERLHGVVETTRRISGFSRLERFGARLLEEFGTHMSAQGGSLYVCRDGRFELVHSLDPGHAAEALTLPPPDGSVLHAVFRTGEPLLIDDIRQAGCRLSGWQGYESGSVLAFPLLGEEDKILGLVSLHARKDCPFTLEDKEIGAVLASYSGEALAAAWAAHAVRESEERKDLALQGASLGMWDWSVPTGKMIFDRRSEEMLGYGRGELEEHVDAWERHVYEDDLPEARKVLDAHLQGLTPHFQCEYRVRACDGRVHWIMDRGKVVDRDADGAPLRVTGTHLDITDRKQAELALKRSEEKFRTILENNPVPMLISDDMAHMDHVNRAFRAQFGYDDGALPSMEDFWRCAFPDEALRLEAMDGWCDAVHGRQGAVREWRIHGRDGSVHDVEWKVMAVGNLTVTTLNDVTERKAAERRIHELNQELALRVKMRTEQLEATREQLEDAAQRAGLADIATGTIHNIGNILSSFNVATEEVADRLEKSKIKSLVVAGRLLEEHKDHLTEYLTQDPKGRQIPFYFLELGKRINLEFEQLKAEIASLSAGIDIMREVITTQQRYALKPDTDETVCLTDMVEHALKLQKHTLDRTGTRVERIFAECPSGHYPRVKLTHVLVNLIKNACESMEHLREANREPVLHIQLGMRDADCFIAVTDNGLGIHAEHLGKIFQHGFSTKPAGHGFGLHTSARWMQEMGGGLAVCSDGPHKGATFTLHFPRNAAEGLRRA